MATKQIADDEWCALQEQIHTCRTCLTDPAFVHSLPMDGRPPNPRKVGRLLLMSEAPPEAGGFWKLPRDGSGDSLDDLRENVLTRLQAGVLSETDFHDSEALQSFLSAGFFLVQTLKWPLAKTAKQRASFNHLALKTKERLVAHAIEHLRSELLAIQPRGILAMGNAAVEACRRLDELMQFPVGGVERVRLSNVSRPEIRFQKRNIPIDVTFLAVDENVRKPTRGPLIRQDFERFLDRHGWIASDVWPAIG